MLTFEGTAIQGATAITDKLTVRYFSPLKSSRRRHRMPRSLALQSLISSSATQSLPFQKVQHKVTTRDAQPSSPSVASLIVNVTGLLVVSTERKESPGAFIFATGTHHPVCLSRSTTAQTHCSFLRCSILSQKVGATTCTYILASPTIGKLTKVSFTFRLMQLQRHFPSQLRCLIEWVKKMKAECRYVIAERNSEKNT